MSSAYSHQRAKRVNARADQRLGHRSPEDRVRYRNEGEDVRECCQNNGSRPLHGRFDDGIVVIQTGRSFSLICSVRIRVLCMRMPANPIKPRMALKPKGWLKMSNIGTDEIKEGSKLDKYHPASGVNIPCLNTAIISVCAFGLGFSVRLLERILVPWKFKA
jgi:hypothetical protein